MEINGRDKDGGLTDFSSSSFAFNRYSASASASPSPSPSPSSSHQQLLTESVCVTSNTQFPSYNNGGGRTASGGSVASGFGRIFDDQTSTKKITLNPHGGSPIGLNLNKSPALINSIEMTLNQERQKKKHEDFLSQPISEKLKASNFPASFLKIGSWERISKNEGDLVAKLYYAKKKLVWEFLEGALKSKIEIQWSEISAIKATIQEGEPGRLQIELNQPPQFGREINPQPRKHTQWKPATDFTGGQAPTYRRHVVIFQPGVLDKHYEKLLQCDSRLFHLSQQPFPSHSSPFFLPDSNAYGDYAYTMINAPGCSTVPASNVHQRIYPPPHIQHLKLPPSAFHMIKDFKSPLSVMKFHEIEQSNAYMNPGTIQAIPTGEQDHPQCCMQESQTFQHPELQFDDIRNQVLMSNHQPYLAQPQQFHGYHDFNSSGASGMNYGNGGVYNGMNYVGESEISNAHAFQELNPLLPGQGNLNDASRQELPLELATQVNVNEPNFYALLSEQAMEGYVSLDGTQNYDPDWL